MNFKIISIFCFLSYTLDAAILGIPALSKIGNTNFVQYRALRDPADSPFNLDGAYDLYGRPVKRSFFSNIPQLQVYWFQCKFFVRFWSANKYLFCFKVLFISAYIIWRIYGALHST